MPCTSCQELGYCWYLPFYRLLTAIFRLDMQLCTVFRQWNTVIATDETFEINRYDIIV
jgi:hypothetical protein